MKMLYVCSLFVLLTVVSAWGASISSMDFEDETTDIAPAISKSSPKAQQRDEKSILHNVQQGDKIISTHGNKIIIQKKTSSVFRNASKGSKVSNSVGGMKTSGRQ